MDGAISDDEDARLSSLRACGVLDTPREVAFDNTVFAVAQLFRAPIAMLNLVAADRVWSKASVGPMSREFVRNETFCRAVVESGHLIVVEDALIDIRFSDLPCVAGEPRVRFFIGAPLLGPGSHVVGALCALDRHPHAVPNRQRTQLQQLALETGEMLRLRVPGLDVTA